MASPRHDSTLPRFSVDEWLLRRKRSTHGTSTRTLGRSDTLRSQRSSHSLLRVIEPVLDEATSQWVRTLFHAGFMRVDTRPGTSDVMEKEAAVHSSFAARTRSKQGRAHGSLRGSESSSRPGGSRLLITCNGDSPRTGPFAEVGNFDSGPVYSLATWAAEAPRSAPNSYSLTSCTYSRRSDHAQLSPRSDSPHYQSLEATLRRPLALESHKSSQRHAHTVPLDSSRPPADALEDKSLSPVFHCGRKQSCDCLEPSTPMSASAYPASKSLFAAPSPNFSPLPGLQEDRFELPATSSSSSSLAPKSGSSTSSLKPDYAPTWISSALYRSKARPNIKHRLKHSLSSGWQGIKCRVKACKRRIARTSRRDS